MEVAPSHPPSDESFRLALGRPGGARRSGIRRLLAGALVALALGVAALHADGPLALRAGIALTLVALAAAVHQGLGSRSRGDPDDAWLVVDGQGVRRSTSQTLAPIAGWNDAFGLTLFASADATTLLFAFTSPLSTRFLSAHRRPDDAPFAPGLLARAVTVTDSDLPAGDDRALSIDDAERLLAAVGARAPAALDRVYLSDATGEPLTLDPVELRIGAKRIDLAAPLEWRAFLFQERGAHAASVCQATWVRQADVEVVLVAPMPGDSGWLGSARATLNAADVRLPREARSGLARDMRLMQASAGDPPPRELRRAIDRVFMLPMRRALDGAPRAPRTRPSLHEERIP
jgi:hypothetical protein